MKAKFNFFLAFFLFPFCLQAQYIKKIQLDSVTIAAVKGGFSVDEFINLVRQDTSFYQAFKNLKYYPYQSKSDLTVFTKNAGEKASLIRTTTQYVKNGMRWIVVDNEQVKGPLRNKKKEYNYYTAELFDYIFFAKDTVPISKNADIKKSVNAKNQNYEAKLKLLIFNPGAKIEGVPLISSRMAIFDPDMVQYYDYRISSAQYKDTVRCYVFSCTAKKDLGYFAKDKPVIKELVSYFDKRTFRIVARKYVLSYSSALFDFDVKMDVHLVQMKDALVPEIVHYDGQWDVPFRKPEIVNFNIRFYNYSIE